MAIQTFTSGQILTAADTNTYLANSGSVAIVPTSVTNGSVSAGTASATANAGVSSISLLGVFSSTYDSYRVVISNLTMSGNTSATSMFAKMHDGANPASSGYNYGVTLIDMTVGTVTSAKGIAQTTGVLIGTGTGDQFGTVFDVVNPNFATHTLFPNLSLMQISNGYTGTGSGMHQISTAYTGIQILPSSGTITGGTITVYGYRK
jgi:hypothetical protein